MNRPISSSTKVGATARARAVGPCLRLLALASVVALVGCGSDESGRGREVTWAEDVAPLVFDHCASCHRPDGIGPFSVLDYESVRTRADLIVDRTARRIMPPWLPVPGHGEFEGDRHLTDEQIDLLRRWAEAGAASGDLALAPAPPTFPAGWQLGEPDLVLELTESYWLSGDTAEVFRNFVLPIPVAERMFVRGVELRPSNPRVVHHATLMTDGTAASRNMDRADPEPGFDGMLFAGGTRNPGGFLHGWTPGMVPSLVPDSLSWALEPGTDLVVQVHLRPTGVEEEEVRIAVGLYLERMPPPRSPFVIRLGSRTLDIPAGDSAYEFEDAYVLPVDVEALGVYPHAHYLGRRMHLTAELPDGSTRWLLRIDDWDFNWQDIYRYAEPVALPRGTTLRVHYTYDNSADNPANPTSPPRRVVYGPLSTDEMAELWLQVVPGTARELEALQRDFAAKDAEDRLAGWRKALELDPDDATAHGGLGAVAQARGDTDEAIVHYEAALRSQPDFVAARYNLALVYQQDGRTALAIAEYRRTLEMAPGHFDALNNLGNILAGLRRFDEAIASYEEALEAEPRHALVRNNLGNALRSTGRLGEAEIRFREAVALRPDYAEAYFNLGLTLRMMDLTDESLAAYQEAARRRPGWAAPLGASAWILATDPREEVRDPSRAVTLARRAVERAGRGDAAMLDVLAVSLAAAGRYTSAVAVGREALAAAHQSGNTAAAAAIAAHVELFASGRSYVEPPRNR